MNEKTQKKIQIIYERFAAVDFPLSRWLPEDWDKEDLINLRFSYLRKAPLEFIFHNLIALHGQSEVALHALQEHPKWREHIYTTDTKTNKKPRWQRSK